MEKVYQFCINDHSIHESDWEECSESQYNEMEGYGIERRIIEREVKVNSWDDLWDKFTMTPEYRQSIKALHIRAYMDWLRDNYEAPNKKIKQL
jgi:hypothetical protein